MVTVLWLAGVVVLAIAGAACWFFPRSITRRELSVGPEFRGIWRGHEALRLRIVAVGLWVVAVVLALAAAGVIA